MTLFLIGYMGSGKTIVGKKLAEILNYDFIDFDDYISQKEQASISDIFKVKGEIYFRKAEYKYLRDVLGLKTTVVSLGGGTPCYGNNMQTLLNTDNVNSIYLKASIPTLTKRLYDERSHRPLIAHIDSKDALSEFIGKHLFERAPFYEQAHKRIDTNDKDVTEIVEEILLNLY
ncbi:shikimate kinase [Psychroserpens sp.]|uniref:shikimate kinase n=1 Tax=Psychroserpens sp. TaxID=2020870 RepID=UPI001B13DB2E|nr:shikimate kinase [Psychroserpens sp.]MBO6607239.1 shikimate kinase [Psychroserpens sp.]MBO6630710.1 shikimate kinase [Psychroserpens sp.]MBO6654385.1 shikimate kinase [Psychroserpens sp.]MBO6682329.1 shikimate kinase [Psychroserpens sp.]MBO6751011.1 shikimate kinase [Psychroserpens sp.]